MEIPKKKCGKNVESVQAMEERRLEESDGGCSRRCLSIPHPSAELSVFFFQTAARIPGQTCAKHFSGVDKTQMSAFPPSDVMQHVIFSSLALHSGRLSATSALAAFIAKGRHA